MKFKATVELQVTVEANNEKNAIYLLRGAFDTGECSSCCYDRNDITCDYNIRSRKVTIARKAGARKQARKKNRQQREGVA